MNINVGIVDQHVRGLSTRLAEGLADAVGRPLDETTGRSVAFVVLCVKVMLDLTTDEALDAITEGGNDFGVDALVVGDLIDTEFQVTLVQGKYYHANLEGDRGFPQSGIEKAVQAVRTLFDPAARAALNPRLQARIDEVRSLILDGNIPRVRFLLCSNGASWKTPEVQEIIERERFGDRVGFEHVNHDTLVRVLQSTTPVRETLQFAGRAVVEDFNYARVFVGRMPVSELARLMDAHGDRLLERNIRRYLGLDGNRVNEAISQTLLDESERERFYFYNNGVTLTCSRFDYNALQADNYRVQVEGLQIINGGQTSKTVQATLAAQRTQLPLIPMSFEQAFVLVRLYQVPPDSTDFVRMITYATNSQNPVDLKDLRSNDERQRRLEMSVRELGYEYRRKRTDEAATPLDISSGTAAEAILSVWRASPQQAKFRGGEHFGKLYDKIFSDDLNGAQLVLAVLLFRIAENRRRRPLAGDPELVRFASCFCAMLMGRYLLSDVGLTLEELDHRSFEEVRTQIDASGDEYFARAVAEVQAALAALYGGQPVNSLRLSATFRRGDLLQHLG